MIHIKTHDNKLTSDSRKYLEKIIRITSPESFNAMSCDIEFNDDGSIITAADNNKMLTAMPDIDKEGNLTSISYIIDSSNGSHETSKYEVTPLNEMYINDAIEHLHDKKQISPWLLEQNFIDSLFDDKCGNIDEDFLGEGKPWTYDQYIYFMDGYSSNFVETVKKYLSDNNIKETMIFSVPMYECISLDDNNNLVVIDEHNNKTDFLLLRFSNMISIVEELLERTYD